MQISYYCLNYIIQTSIKHLPITTMTITITPITSPTPLLAGGEATLPTALFTGTYAKEVALGCRGCNVYSVGKKPSIFLSFSELQWVGLSTFEAK